LAGEPFPGLTRNDENGAPGRLNPKDRSAAEDRRGRIFCFAMKAEGRGKNPAPPVSGGPVVVQFRAMKGREWLSLAERSHGRRIAF
jgi:hypothetical protein